MATIAVPEVRKRCKLLKQTDISDSDLMDFIYEAEAYINLLIGGSYSIPIRPLTYPSGTISVVQGNNTINGSGSLFLTEKILPGQHLFIVDSNETIVIESVANETSLKAKVFSFEYPNLDEPILSTPINTTVSGSTYYIIPEEICTATKYLAAKLALMEHFSEQSYKQDTKAFYEKYELFAAKIINEMKSNDYINSSLVPSNVADSHGSLIIKNTEDYRTTINSRLDRIYTNQGRNL